MSSFLENSATIPIVFIVDDDKPFRISMESLLRYSGFEVRSFAAAHEFLLYKHLDTPACLLLDVRMRGMNGLDLQQELNISGIHIPVIFLSGHADVPISVQAMKAGAVEFLIKPVHEQTLLDAIGRAIRLDCARREELTKIASVISCYESLTSSEREIMSRVVAGFLNKQIAADLAISEKTVKFHRAHVMQKMNAKSLADLVRMAGMLEKHS